MYEKGQKIPVFFIPSTKVYQEVSLCKVYKKTHTTKARRKYPLENFIDTAARILNGFLIQLVILCGRGNSGKLNSIDTAGLSFQKNEFSQERPINEFFMLFVF